MHNTIREVISEVERIPKYICENETANEIAHICHNLALAQGLMQIMHIWGLSIGPDICVQTGFGWILMLPPEY